MTTVTQIESLLPPYREYQANRQRDYLGEITEALNLKDPQTAERVIRELDLQPKEFPALNRWENKAWLLQHLLSLAITSGGKLTSAAVNLEMDLEGE